MKLMVVVLTVFTVCNIPDVASHLAHAFAEETYVDTVGYDIMRNTTNAFHFNNAAWNFFIYMGCNEKFRQSLKEMFMRRKPDNVQK